MSFKTKAISMKKISATAFVFLIFSFLCLAQKVEKTLQELSIATENIDEGTTNFVLFTEQGGKIQRFVSFIEMTIRTDKEFIHITQRHYNLNRTEDLDSSVVYRKNFAPVYYSAKLNNGMFIEEYKFSDHKIEGKRGDPEKPEMFTEEYEQEQIFNAVTQDVMLQTIPFANESSISCTIYNPGKKFLDVTYRVLGKEILDFSGVSIKALKMEMDGALLPTIIWLSDETGQLLQQRSTLPNGSVFWKKKVL